MTIKKTIKKEKTTLPTVFTKLILRDVKVVFVNLIDEGFGTSITIDSTEKTVKEKISDWVAENMIGKDTPGVAIFKEYTPEEGNTVFQYSFKINKYTKYKGLEGLTEENIGFGSVIDLVVNAFPYDNKFGQGVSQSLSAVLIKTEGTTSADKDMAELISDIEF